MVMLNEALVIAAMTMNPFDGHGDEHVQRCTKTPSKHKGHGPAIPKRDHSH